MAEGIVISFCFSFARHTAGRDCGVGRFGRGVGPWKVVRVGRGVHSAERLVPVVGDDVVVSVLLPGLRGCSGFQAWLGHCGGVCRGLLVVLKLEQSCRHCCKRLSQVVVVC